ncbi:MAG: NUDIX hydrolase [Chryseosolibacter sp.]
MDAKITRLYGDRVRVRVCGLCWQGANLLMVKHRHLANDGFWAPPGGGLEFGESIEQCLKKEFLEETGLLIGPGRFQFGCEFIQKPLHAVELFFEVNITGGLLQKGDDPELPMIEEVRYLSPAEIAEIPSANLHGIFGLAGSPEALKTLTGFYRI